MSKITVIVAGLSVLALAGCKGGSENGQPAEASSSSGMPANWKATDACSIIDKATMGEVMKAEVTETSLGLVHEPDAATAGTSECKYTFKDGGDATVMTRWSPIADNTAEAISATRSVTASSMKAFSDKPIEDVSGVGKAAFLVPGINQFNVFLDESRFMVITLGGAPANEVKDRVIALARKAGG
jgi:hypothetical protein